MQRNAVANAAEIALLRTLLQRPDTVFKYGFKHLQPLRLQGASQLRRHMSAVRPIRAESRKEGVV
jgi:transposase-like protein